MSRRSRSLWVWLVVVTVAVGAHAAAIALFASGEHPGTDEEQVRALFEKQRAQLEERDYEGLWQGLSEPLRAAILGRPPVVTSAGSSWRFLRLQAS